MKARCLDCGEMVEADDENCFQTASPLFKAEFVANCPGNQNCRADDPHADDAYNDPRSGQAAAINAANRRTR